MTTAVTKPASGTWLYVVTLFVSAGLLFAVQPMLGKMMLPLVGGSPSGWLTALAFFQLALLAGYLLAHGLSRLSARGQAWATVGVLALGFIQLPPGFGGSSGVENVDSAWGVVELLLRAIFVPYLGLATVSSGLQRLYAARAGAGSDPYFLYAASNAGSFVGLLAYPLVVEPLVPLSVQSVGWLVGYGLLVALIVALAWPKGGAAVAATATPTPTAAKPPPPLTWRQRGQWVLLAFIPSSLSMGLTSLVTADLGSFPLLWVIPLGLYLLTFVVAFAQRQNVNLNKLGNIQLTLFIIQLLIFIGNHGIYVRDWWFTVIPLALFFASAMWCHVCLANIRPGLEYLTEYYLWLAFGGALGGIFNVFIAPNIFFYPLEFILTACGSICLHRLRYSEKLSMVMGYALAAAITLLFGFYLALAANSGMKAILFMPAVVLAAGLFFYPRLYAVVGVLLVTYSQIDQSVHNRLSVSRNFFGVVEVAQVKNNKGDLWRYYVNGAGIHGAQLMNAEADKPRNILFFNPIRDLSAVSNFENVGILGAGPAMALCLGGKQKRSVIYEVDPLAKLTAETWFSYTKDCGEPKWHIGDGRLELQRDTQARHDLLIIDAFSAGSIPAHLLTMEAMDVYLSRLAPGGLIVFNTNNLYYDLRKPLLAIAAQKNLQAWVYRSSTKSDLANGIAEANWVLLAATGQDMNRLSALGWRVMPHVAAGGFPVWRDDLANVLAALKLFNSTGGDGDIIRGVE